MSRSIPVPRCAAGVIRALSLLVAVGAVHRYIFAWTRLLISAALGAEQKLRHDRRMAVSLLFHQRSHEIFS